MFRTLKAGKLGFKRFAAIIEGFYNEIDTNINNINSQNSVISMELLTKINVKIINMYKKHVITYYNFEKALLCISPGLLLKDIKNSYGLFMGRLARG
jgi:hypothetical protein